MKRFWHVERIWIALVAAMVSFAVAGEQESVDARNPEEWRARRDAEKLNLSRWPHKRILQLAAERERLLQQIAVLPKHDPQPLPDRLGYHSAFGDSSSLSNAHHELEVEWKTFYAKLYSIALAPAFNSKNPGGGPYAFPKRFEIEAKVLGRRWKGDKETGHWVDDPLLDEWVEIANWLDEDFPDPGPYPVFFDVTERRVKQVRMTVPLLERESGAGYYALGEIYVFRRLENGEMGDNMTFWWDVVDIRVSDSFSVYPLWDKTYLYDGAVGFGLPLSGQTDVEEDFMVTFEDHDPVSEQVEFLMDLGVTQKIGRIEFWPAEAPGQMAVSMFGFPGEITVELSPDPDFSTSRIIEVKDAGEQLFHDNLLTVICKGYEGRYIRISLRNLSEFKGRPILGLGEISVAELGKILSMGSKVTARGIPERYLPQLPRLVDGCSRRCRILPEGEWIRGLALRRPLDQRLTVVEQKLTVAKESWRTLQFRLSIAGLVVLVLSLLGGWGFLRMQRQQILKRLKLRITQDLHDEVGSNLGSISLMADQLRSSVVEEDLKEDMFDLSLLAREACASLREVVWVVDQNRISLPELIRKMVERAERVMSGIRLSIDVSQECPDVEVSLVYKRHLQMFFKEAVHNCVRHAEATQAWLSFFIEQGQLLIVLVDNGRGFDPNAATGGWGVKNMRKRAEEMGGILHIQSAPGKGTEIRLSIPFSKLVGEPSKAYSTSN
ncbi:sensor histidine kinase [Pontiella sulfatireligans]|uniref:Sensor protein VraS n=1 Tax=Pontiella sulfatireligans TaxID=2750658 RepID=A0A6C2UKV8_9BACT|nr:ATP-binding protein [Pontiella sulfatireligans]VGO20875.1 Sensor protein VraS [Pontiella sulfatireligans]